MLVHLDDVDQLISLGVRQRSEPAISLLVEPKQRTIPFKQSIGSIIHHNCLLVHL
jgi:hypothetical protein